MATDPMFPIRVFDDVGRVFVEGTITLADITDISDEVTEHYGFKTTSRCVRVGLGPGKWAYVEAAPAPQLRESWRQWKEEHPYLDVLVGDASKTPPDQQPAVEQHPAVEPRSKRK